jgi:uncharacterized metal-binding protein YceD (DUF177 family)
MRHFLPWLLKAGLSEQFVKEHFVEFGQGMQSMSPALRDLEQVLLEGQIATVIIQCSRCARPTR